MFCLFVALSAHVAPVLTTRVLHSRYEGLMKHGRQPVTPPWDLVQEAASHQVPEPSQSAVSAMGLGTGGSISDPSRPNFFQPAKLHVQTAAAAVKSESASMSATEPSVVVSSESAAAPVAAVPVVKEVPLLPKALVEATKVEKAEKKQDPLLCLQHYVGVNPGESKDCPEGKCSDGEGICRKQQAKRLPERMRIAPAGLSGSFLRAEVFPANRQSEPALRLVDGWRWEREDATWLLVMSPDNTSVFLSTLASWPEDMEHRDGPVRVLDLNSQGQPEMLPLRSAGQAEWRLEDAGHGQIRMRHVHQGRYLQAPTAAGFLQALVQLWSPPPPLMSVNHVNAGSAFQVTPESALDELRNLGLIGQAPPPPIPRLPNIEVTVPLPSKNGKELKTVSLPWGAFIAVILILICCCCAGGTWVPSAAADPRRDRKRKGHSDVERRLREVIERARRADLERALGTEGQLHEQLKYVVGRARRIRSEAVAEKRPWDPAPSLPEAEKMLALMDTRRPAIESGDGGELSDGFSTPRAAGVNLHRK